MESGRACRDSSENYERSRSEDSYACELEKTDDLSDSPWRFLLTCSRPNTDPILLGAGTKRTLDKIQRRERKKYKKSVIDGNEAEISRFLCLESLAFLFDVALDHAVKTSHVDPLRGMQAEQGIGVFNRERIGENQTSSGTQKAG